MRNENLEVKDFEAGIEIVSIEKVSIKDEKTYKFLVKKAIISCVGTLICTLIACVVMDVSQSMFVLPFIAFVILSVISAVNIKSTIKIETRYKVKLDGTVDMKEFTRKHKILDQDGDIYTVVPKDKTEE